MTTPSDDMHRNVRRGRTTAFAEMMDKVYRSMTWPERESLPQKYPEEIGEYVNAIVALALGRLATFGDDLKRAVVGTFEESRRGERFILDPTRADSLNEYCLFVDSDGELVTVRDPELARTQEGSRDPGTLVLRAYKSYQVLTGPRAGVSFPRHVRPLPDVPALNKGDGAAEQWSSNRSVPPSVTGLSVFLCHASEDKVPVRNLLQTLRSWGHDPWLDEERILPGQDWEREIRHAMRQAHIVIVCLSPRSEKRGYVQKELRRALDIADEQPEGTIFIVPVKLEPCSVPERLTKWHWVDLFSNGGEGKLEAALHTAARSLQQRNESQVSAP